MNSKTKFWGIMSGAAAKVGVACAAVALACAAEAGSLTWLKDTTAAKVMSKAKKAGKPVFLLCGRETCYNTTTTRDRSCEQSPARDALGNYVLWFSDCDDNDEWWADGDGVYKYASGLGTFGLPLVCVINPYKPDAYVVRSTGIMDSSGVKALLDKASGKVFKKVTFNGNGGTASTSSRNVLNGGKVGTLPKATRKGYTLKGWFTAKSAGSEVSNSTKVTKNVTYYAQWTKNEYTIKFNKNGGTGSMGSISATYGKSVTLPSNAFKKSGYKFAGWATKKSGAVVYKNKATVKNLTDKADVTVTLYAVWKKKSSKAAAVAGYAGAGKAAKTKISFTSATKELAKTPAKATAGKSFSLKIGVKPSTSGLTFTAKNLPKGLSIGKKTGKITGKPTKPGSYTATVTVKSAAGNKITQKVKIKVSILSWARGTFYGYAFPDGGNNPGGYLTFTVSSIGKISGKVTYKGTAYPFTTKYTYCSTKKAKFTPDAMKLGSKTLDPGQIVVAANQDRIKGISVIEAVNVNSIYIAQKPVGLVCPGGELEAALHGYSYTFREGDVGSGLGAGDSLNVKVENGVVMVGGRFGGKKLATSNIPLFVTSRTTTGSGDVAYSLCVYIYDHKANYCKWLFFNITVDDAGNLIDFDPEFRS